MAGYSPRVHITHGELNIAETSVVDAYNALSSTEKAHFRNHLYLCDESSTEMGYGYAEMSDPSAFLEGIPAYLGTVYQAEILISNLSDSDQLTVAEYAFNIISTEGLNTFFEEQGVMWVRDAQKESWLESVFPTLNDNDQALFLAFCESMFVVDAQTESWLETVWSILDDADKLLFLDFIEADPETLVGVMHGYSHLNDADQLSAFESFCANLRKKPSFYNVTFKH